MFNSTLSIEAQKAIEENSKHICPHTKEPCKSLACGVRHSGVCSILEVMKHSVSEAESDYGDLTKGMTPEEIKSIEEMADEAYKLSNLERRLLKEAAVFIRGFEIAFTTKERWIHKWIEEYTELEKHFK